MKKILKLRLLKNRHVDENSCWLWTGYKYGGYGRMFCYGKNDRVPRVAMHVYQGFDLNSRGHVLHRCDVPACFNPDHLYVGDQRANNTDREKRGRTAKGSKHYLAILTETQVANIKKRLRAGERAVNIARGYGICASVIGQIKRGETWKHVEV